MLKSVEVDGGEYMELEEEDVARRSKGGGSGGGGGGGGGGAAMETAPEEINVVDGTISLIIMLVSSWGL